MLNTDTKRRIDNARDILVGQLPLPSDQVELITIALIYKFMSDIDEQSTAMGGRASYFTGDLRELSWQHLVSNTLGAAERVTKFEQGIEALSRPEHRQIPELFKSIFNNAFLKFRDGRILKLFIDEINGFTYDHSEELGNAYEYLLQSMGT
jgi:type I restriction enzyme M protein